MDRTVAIDGMTCRACERRVERALTRLPEVRAAHADAARARVRLTLAGDVSRSALASALARAGEDYRLRDAERREWLSRDPRVWRDVAVAVVAVAALVLLVQASGLTSLADRVGAGATSGSLAVVVLLGVAAGFSTCMALVGGLVLAFSARTTARSAGEASGTWQRWVPHLAFNAGRVLGFAALGGLTGLLGSVLTLSGPALAVAMLAVAVVMTLLGIQLSGASPRLAGGLVPTLPDVLGARLQRAAERDGGARRTAALAAGVGAATYLLPCGFTQAVQLYALSTGSAAQGAAIMAAFALGTTPGLLGIGGLSVSLRGAWAQRFTRFAAVAVLGFAMVNAAGAVGILTGGSASAAPAASTISANVRIEDGVQYVATTQVADGYEPATAVVYADMPVVWQLDSEALTCASWLRAPDLGIPSGTVLAPGETQEFRFTPDEPGSLRYSCGMGMYWGAFQVIDAPEGGEASPA